MTFAAVSALQEEAHASAAFQRTRFLAFAIMVTGCKQWPFVPFDVTILLLTMRLLQSDGITVNTRH